MTAPLTPREKQVCKLVVRGLCNKEIAHELGISRRTIEDHRDRIFEKMEVRNAVELVRKIYRLDQFKQARARRR